jgi:hypothetical protein
MTDRLSIRLTSFALAVLITVAVFMGIDSMALQQAASNAQLAQLSVATSVQS